ncbi:nuclear transport factor 2 family protein [Pararhizobium gei]|uniref:nuclear transport factor 2 family protein n=1 Tax=Pararhizobium gei TaxID=1395951 RepID=UPI0023DA34AF|nr:nuclear transport factor 2 family protein [Rhizobium gei]
MTAMFDPVQLTQDFHAAIGALDFAAIDSFFAEDAIYISGKVGDLRGRSAIMAAFRGYFEEYPDQVAEDSGIEALSAFTSRSVWHLAATSTKTGMKLERRGEEVITFNGRGRIISVTVTDYPT